MPHFSQQNTQIQTMKVVPEQALSHNIFATHAQTRINQQMLHLFRNMLFNLLA
jgi:hypothetical protein